MLKAIGKYIDTLPLMRLFSQEERNADTVTIEVDRYHDGHDLAHFRFMMRGITESGGETESPLVITMAEEDTLQLTWTVAPEFTVEGGMLALDLFAYRYEEGTDPATEPPDVIVRYQLPDVLVRPLRDKKLESTTYTEFLLEVRRTAENAIIEIEHMLEDGILPEALHNRLAAAEAAITQLRSTLASHTSDIATLLGDVSQLETTVGAHSTSISTLSGAVSQLETTVGSHGTSISTLSGAVSQLGTTVGSHGTSIAALESSVTSQGTRLTTLENSFVPIVILTQSEYDAIVTPAAGTLYVIREINA